MTEKFDPKAALARIGVDPAIAETLVSKLQGGDYVNLVNALNNPDPSQGRLDVKKILIKYGVNPAMTKESSVSENAYLQSRFEALKTGKKINEWLQPINESTNGDYVLLREAGYDYQTNIPSAVVDPMIDWLDTNQIEYLTDGTHFQLKCNDPETQFKISRKINELFNRAEARGNHEDETMHESKSAKKREAAAKEKLANLKPQNPIVQAMSTRGGGGAHKAAEDPRKADKYGRKAKHRKDPMDESYEIGESVLVDGHEATVQIPQGPNGTIGVIMDGELTMVSESQVQLNEGVMGMTKINPLFRLRELAGLAPAPMASPGIEAEASPAQPVEVADDLGDIDDAEPAVPMAGIDPDPVDDLETDLGLSGPASLASDPVNGGVPGDLPPAGGMDVVSAPQSEAMAQIEDALNGIQRQLADIRLSEYKTVMRKLQDLTNQVQMMGRDYLGERRRK